MQDETVSKSDGFRRTLALTGAFFARHRRAVIAVAVGVPLVVLAVGPVSLVVPVSCNACHGESGAYAQWKASAHSDAGCQDCHAERGYLAGLGNSAALATEVWRSVFGGPGDAAWVPDEACLDCHPDIGSEQTFTVGELRMSHVGLAEAGYRCVECHGDAAHEYRSGIIPEPKMSTCVRCHNNVSASGKCGLCHAGTTEADKARRVDAEWSKTHGANWQQLHGMGELSTCSLCHRPEECESCHGMPLPHDSGFGATHGTRSMESIDRCLQCHTQAYCDSCHGLEMPHPDGFLAQHSSVAEGHDDPLCKRCHVMANCTECHTRHIHPATGL